MLLDFPGGLVGRVHLQCRRRRRHELYLWVRKIAWRRKLQPIPVFLPGESWTEEPEGLYSLGLQRVWQGLAPKQQCIKNQIILHMQM